MNCQICKGEIEVNERYERLFSLPKNLYTSKAPVIILAGALLKDHQTGNVLAQLKFNNLSLKMIEALSVQIKCFNIIGEELQGTEYQYLDLSAARHSEFGQRTAIQLPDNTTRSISVVCTNVVFSDHTFWNAEEGAVWDSLPSQQNLENIIGNLAEQYRRETSSHSRFVPLEYSDLWICSCGTVNKQGDSYCCRCGIKKQQIFSALNVESLTQNREQFQAEQAQHKAIQEEKQKERRIKIRKIAVTSTIAATVAVMLIVLVTQVLIPMQKYNSAVSSMEAGEYEQAIDAFKQLQDYSDSEDKVKECEVLYQEAILQDSYQEAVKSLEQGDYVQAINVFAELGDYKDSQEQMQEATYQYANNLAENQYFYSAITMFDSLGEYEDSVSRVKEVQQLWIDYIYQLIEEGEYDDAWDEYDLLNDYSPSPLSQEDYLVTLDNGSNTVDVRDDHNEDSWWTCYYYDPSVDKNREGVVTTDRGVKLGDTELELLLAYGTPNERGEFNGRNNFYRDADSTISSFMEKDCKTYLRYTFDDEDYMICFYLDENEKVSFIFYAYNYEMIHYNVVGTWGNQNKNDYWNLN